MFFVGELVNHGIVFLSTSMPLRAPPPRVGWGLGCWIYATLPFNSDKTDKEFVFDQCHVIC